MFYSRNRLIAFMTFDKMLVQRQHVFIVQHELLRLGLQLLKPSALMLSFQLMNFDEEGFCVFFFFLQRRAETAVLVVHVVLQPVLLEAEKIIFGFGIFLLVENVPPAA